MKVIDFRSYYLRYSIPNIYMVSGIALYGDKMKSSVGFSVLIQNNRIHNGGSGSGNAHAWSRTSPPAVPCLHPPGSSAWILCGVAAGIQCACIAAAMFAICSSCSMLIRSSRLSSFARLSVSSVPWYRAYTCFASAASSASVSLCR